LQQNLPGGPLADGATQEKLARLDLYLQGLKALVVGEELELPSLDELALLVLIGLLVKVFGYLLLWMN